jgi:hypothetical protein
MGCDIHMHYEIRTTVGWWPFKRTIWKHFDWRAPHVLGTYEDGSIEYDWDGIRKDPLALDRNYDLFALLAGVRNYHLANPISFPRGLPSDVTSEVLRESDRMGSDGHSHSWLSLREVTEFNYDKVISDRCSDTHREAIGPEWFATIEALRNKFGIDNVRLVFWFDN